MRIGQVAHKYLPSVGGIENYVYRLARDLSRAGHEVRIFAPTHMTKGAEANVQIVPTRVIATTSRNPIPVGLSSQIRRENLDLIHFHSPWYFSSIVPLLRGLDIPSIMTVHGAFPESANVSERLLLGALRGPARMALAHCTIVIALTNREESKIRSMLGVPQAKVRVIPNGVDLHECRMKNSHAVESQARKNKRILFVGRVTRDSRLPLVLEAFRGVHSLVPGSELILAGPGTAALNELTQKSPSGTAMRGITALGLVSSDRLCELYNSSALFVSVGTWEGLPTRVLEAMAHGCVPVVAASGGLPDVVQDGFNGVLQSNTSSAELMNTLVGLLRDSKRREALGRAARHAVERDFSWPSVFERILRAYREIVPFG